MFSISDGSQFEVFSAVLIEGVLVQDSEVFLNQNPQVLCFNVEIVEDDSNLAGQLLRVFTFVLRSEKLLHFAELVLQG